VAILHFCDVSTFNYALCIFIAHFIFQMRKVLVTSNSNQTTRPFLPGGHGQLGMRMC